MEPRTLVGGPAPGHVEAEPTAPAGGTTRKAEVSVDRAAAHLTRAILAARTADRREVERLVRRALEAAVAAAAQALRAPAGVGGGRSQERHGARATRDTEA